jgi:hypothetical protein
MKIHTTTRKLAVSALVATTLGATMSINAALLQPTVGFVTVVDIIFSTESGLSFGQNVVGTAGTSCTMLTSTLAGATVTAAAASGTIEDSISGTGCLTQAANGGANNFSGVYGMVGQFNQAFSITVASSTDGDFSFTPTAVVCDVATGCDAGGTNVFADTTELSAFDAAGLAMVVVAGTITIGAADLTPNTPYSQTFDITATY